MERVYVTEFPDGTLIRWKPLSWSEYRQLVRDYGHLLDKGAVAWHMFDAIGRLCILDQQQGGEDVDYDALYAGAVWVVAQTVLQISGFLNEPDSIRNSLGAARASIYGDWYEEVKGYLLHLFRVTEDEIDAWPREKFMRYVARAELLMGKEIPVEDPREQQKGRRPVRFTTDEHGNRVPVVTKENLEDASPITPMADNEAMQEEALRKPDGEFNLKRLRMLEEKGGVKTQGHARGKHPARLAAERGEKVHPLRRRMMKAGMI